MAKIINAISWKRSYIVGYESFLTKDAYDRFFHLQVFLEVIGRMRPEYLLIGKMMDHYFLQIHHLIKIAFIHEPHFVA